MKPIGDKRFYFTIHERLYWSDLFQSLNKSAVDLMMCMYAELRWTCTDKKRSFTNNGKISFSEKKFKFNGLVVSQTYLNARNQLIWSGFIKVTYREGMARGDCNQYELLWVDGVHHDRMRWKNFPEENWEHEKDYGVGRETSFKNKKNTLKDKTLNHSDLS
ncbi:MAG: hypothetical protein ACJZ1R_06000 [Candidatus Neomarinimicrobiota bacterium]